MTKLYPIPVMLTEAKAFVASFHRHNKPPVSGLFSVGVGVDCELIGVAIVGRPVARGMQDGRTAEVTRCCVREGAQKGACSFLYAACWRAARALGWSRLITYTLASEGRHSLKGAGFKLIAELDERNPREWQSRHGREWQPVVGQAKLRWEIAA